MNNDMLIAASTTISHFNIKEMLITIKEFKKTKAYDCIGCTPLKWEELKEKFDIPDKYYYGILYGLPIYVFENKKDFLELLIEFNQKGLWIE